MSFFNRRSRIIPEPAAHRVIRPLHTVARGELGRGNQTHRLVRCLCGRCMDSRALLLWRTRKGHYTRRRYFHPDGGDGHRMKALHFLQLLRWEGEGGWGGMSTMTAARVTKTASACIW